MASRLQDVIARGLAAAKPLATAVAPGTLYYSTDTAVTERSDGTIWETYADSASGGIPGLHAPTHASGGTDPVTLAQSQITGLVADLALKAPSVHATSHFSAGSDPVNVTALAGFPGTTTTFLRGDAAFSALPVRIGWANLVIGDGSTVITTGVKAYIVFPACTILEVVLLANVSGSVVLDLWKAAYSAYPPTVANTIVAAAKPTISAAIKSQDTTLTGWTLTMADGDILAVNVDSASTITKLTMGLKIQAV